MRVNNTEQAIDYLLNRFGTTNILTPTLDPNRVKKLVPKYIYEHYLSQDEQFMQALRQAGYRDDISYPNEPALLDKDYNCRRLLGITYRNTPRTTNTHTDSVINGISFNERAGLLAKDLIPIFGIFSDNSKYFKHANHFDFITDSAQSITEQLKTQTPWLYQPDSQYVKMRSSADKTSLLIDVDVSIFFVLKSIQDLKEYSPKLEEVYNTLLTTLNISHIDFYNKYSLKYNTLYKSEIPIKYPEFETLFNKHFSREIDNTSNLDLEKLKYVADLPLSDYINKSEAVQSVKTTGTGSTYHINTSRIIQESEYWLNGYSTESYLTRYVAKDALSKGRYFSRMLSISTNPAFLFELVKAYTEHNGSGLEKARGSKSNVLFHYESLLGKIIEACCVRDDTNTIQGTATVTGVIDGVTITTQDVLNYISEHYTDYLWTVTYARSKTNTILDITEENDQRLARNIVLYNRFLETDVGRAIGHLLLPLTSDDLWRLREFQFIVAEDISNMYFNRVYKRYKDKGLQATADHYIETLGKLPAISPSGNYFTRVKREYKKPNRTLTNADTPATRVPPQVEALLQGKPVSQLEYTYMAALLSYHVQYGKHTTPTQATLGTKSCTALGVPNLYTAYTHLIEHRVVWCIYSLARLGVTWAIRWMVTNPEDFHKAGIFDLNNKAVRNWLAQQARAVN